MNIVMMTNTYSPHVGGVAKSIEAFIAEYHQRGHRVLVVAPMFENVSEHEQDIIRIPAIQHFNGSDFSVAWRIPTWRWHFKQFVEPRSLGSSMMLVAMAVRERGPGSG